MNIAYFGYNSKEWMGGINYLKNLLFAIKSNKSIEIKPYIFFKRTYDPAIMSLFEPLAECVVLDLKKPIPFLFKVIDRILLKKTDFFTRYYLKKYKIDIISHSEIDCRKLKVKNIGWVPDFQHIHLPEMFSKEELRLRDIKYKKAIDDSSLTIVSSTDAAKDLKLFYPAGEIKTRLLHFVSQIDTEIYDVSASYKNEIEQKYNFSGNFFFLPNKFYKHKNHKVVFEAVDILKNEGIDVLLICTGYLSAWESEQHIADIVNYIAGNNLSNHIKTLGLISYKDVQYFMRNAVSVINPSLFEGWASSVEECKSMGKNMIISDIEVHREQNPPQTEYFDPYNANQLAAIMKKKWLTSKGGPDFVLEDESRKNLKHRTIEFGQNYYDICKSVI